MKLNVGLNKFLYNIAQIVKKQYFIKYIIFTYTYKKWPKCL